MRVLFLLFFGLLFQKAIAQEVEKLDESTFDQVLKALLTVNYNAEQSKKPEISLFYYDDFGSYQVKVIHKWQIEDSEHLILEEIKRYAKVKIENEINFDHLDLNWLEEKIGLYSSEVYANLIYYNETKNEGFLRVYKLSD